MSTEMYCNDDSLIIDEIITFFFAGMKTIQTSTANLFYYLAKDQKVHKKLMSEILGPVASVGERIVEGLDYDTVNDFEYLQ